MKKSVNLTLNINEVKEAISDYLKRKDIYISKNAFIELEEDFNSEYVTSNSARVIVSYSEDADLDKAEDKPQASADACSNKDSYDGREDPKEKTCIYPSINDFNKFYDGKKDLTWDEMCGR